MKNKGIEFETRQVTDDSERKEPVPAPCVMILFGATGDLSSKKLVPALYNLDKAGGLPSDFHLIGFSRTGLSSLDFQERTRKTTEIYSRTKPLDDAVWDRFSARIDYVSGSFDDSEAYKSLRDKILEIEKAQEAPGLRLFFLATASGFFPVIIKNLAGAGLFVSSPPEEGPVARVVIEKPFGRDLDSARQLNRMAAEYLDEEQIFRVDHFLAKETVQNILVFRFANSIFEPVWNNRYIDHVQITLAEDFGIEKRGVFYDETGVVRDIIQNHLLQLLALTAMEAPARFNALEIRDEKTKLFRFLRMWDNSRIADNIIVGQYRGYRDETGVAPDSKTPTFAALKLRVDNWRWQGVPFYVRAGKMLKSKLTEVSIHFRPVPACLFEGMEACKRAFPNVLTLRIQPGEGITLSFVGKVPGDGLELGEVTMDFNYAGGFEREPREAYERLLLDCIRGDQTLFARKDGSELEWEVVTPILEVISSENFGSPFIYEPGSEGPEESFHLIAREGRSWRPL